MANPTPKDFDKRQFETLLQIQCTQAEIIAVLGTSKITLQKWVKENYNGRNFTQVSEEFRAFGKASLRRSGFKLAERNPAVWIFMAKNYLGMSDEPKAESTGEEKKELESAIKAGLRSIHEMGAENLARFPKKPDVEEEHNEDEEDVVYSPHQPSVEVIVEDGDN